MALQSHIEFIVGYVQEDCRVCDEVSRERHAAGVAMQYASLIKRNTGMIFMIFALV